MNRGHKSTIGRLIADALFIKNEPRYQILNTKSEWGLNFFSSRYQPPEMITRMTAQSPELHQRKIAKKVKVTSKYNQKCKKRVKPTTV